MPEQGSQETYTVVQSMVSLDGCPSKNKILSVSYIVIRYNFTIVCTNIYIYMNVYVYMTYIRSTSKKLEIDIVYICIYVCMHMHDIFESSIDG